MLGGHAPVGFFVPDLWLYQGHMTGPRRYGARWPTPSTC